MLREVRAKRLTSFNMREAIREHLVLLRDQALMAARNSNVRIKVLCVTYPNYLCDDERTCDFEKYMAFYEALLSEIWVDEQVTIEEASEGQSAAVFFTEDFHDLLGLNRVQRRRLFRGLDTTDGLNIIVADAGSSSLNLQVQNVYLGADGRITKSQSSVFPGGLKGTRSPSQPFGSQAWRLTHTLAFAAGATARTTGCSRS